MEDDTPGESLPAAPTRLASRDSAAEDASPRLRPFRPLKAGADQEPFLRARRRVPVRRGVLPAWARSRWGRILFTALILAVFAAGIALAFAVRAFFLHSGQFRIASTDSIQTLGNTEVSRDAILSVFGSDVGHDVFFVPLVQRRDAVERMPWVKSATVMRILPDRLRVSIAERTPVAFLRSGSRISLIDAQGIVLHLAPAAMARRHFSFPVITGLNPAIPRPMRARRMQLYGRFIAALDSGGKHFSSQISEVDLSDPEDIRANVVSGRHDLLLHFGRKDFLARYQRYAANIQGWLAQYPALSAVDLRYHDQVVLTLAHPVGSESAAKANPGTPPKHVTQAAHRATGGRR